MTNGQTIPLKKTSPLSFFLILILAVILWTTLRGPGTDADGLKSAYLIETGQALNSLSDHLLWQELSLFTYTIGKCLDPAIRGIPAQQVVNLFLFSIALFTLWRYLRSWAKSFWLVSLGLLASYTSLRTLVGEDVDVGPLLMNILILFILPGVTKQKGLWATIFILSLAPVLHKSLLLLTGGWWLAQVFLGEGELPKRILRASLILLISVSVAFLFYFASWVLLSGDPSFNHWIFPHGEKTPLFFSLNPLVVLKGLALVSYRSFLSVYPLKAFAQSDAWGIIGLIFSVIAASTLLLLVAKSIWQGKTKAPLSNDQQKHLKAIILTILPGFIFFLFWIPGYYTYWARFVPAFWIMLAFRLPNRVFWGYAAKVVIGLLLAVNLPSQFRAKDGEEAGLLSRWLAPKLNKGDILIIPGNGVLYFGSMPQYYYHVEIIPLHALETFNDKEGFLKSHAAQAWQQGHHVWLVMDYAKWTSERLLQGEQIRFTKGMAAVENTFALGPKEEFTDPAFKEAWIAQCLPR